MFFLILFMKKYFFITVLFLFCCSIAYSFNEEKYTGGGGYKIKSTNKEFVKIDYDFEKNYNCEFLKTLIKNKEFNYKTFNSGEIKNKGPILLNVNAKKPEFLNIEGLSYFFSNIKELEIKILNDKVLFFRGVNDNKNYSESAILTRKTGELIHETTKNIKTEDMEKDITFYNCKVSNPS